MQRAKWVACVALSVLAVACSGSNSSAPAAKADAPAMANNMDMAKPAAAPTTDEEKIKSAMSAAPEAVGKGAAIMDMAADGSMKQLRAGTNGFTCLPDNPGTPGPDPMCVDANGMAWMDAMLKKQPPPPGKASLMYMLAGGTDASNTDPYATAPTANNHWIKTGPHVMIVGATDMLAGYPSTPDPDTSAPYVMWAGTPYAHIMMPVK